MLNIQMRPAKPNDVNALTLLLNQLGYDTPKEKLLPFITTDTGIFVAELDKKVVAIVTLIYFNYFPTAELYCRITTLVVDKELRGWGIGKNLIAFAKQQAQAKSCTHLELTTALKRTEAHAFYEHLGFKQASYKYIMDL